DLDDDTLSGLTLFSKKVARAIDKAIDCKRVGVVVLGLEVPHAHVHLIPLNSESDASFSKPKLKLTKDEFETIAEKIRSAIE
ncbi:MAG: HIT family protein, partial [Bacteroidales bacterium]